MRVFIGLAVSEDVREELRRLRCVLEKQAAGRYVPAENYHITLLFIGEVERKQLPVLQSILTDAAASFAAPKLALGKTGHFGKSQDAILHCGLEEQGTAMHIEQYLREACAEFAFDAKPFRAHITLARKINMAAFEGILPECRPLTWQVESLHVYESRREANGLRYIPIISAAFAKQ